jgi:glycosyltransferase involved in cell wall biosynthesis
LDALLQAALHHQNTHFVLIAGGRAESEVVSAKEKVLAAKLAERFHFFNELPLHNYAQLLRASDVAVSMNPSFDMRSSSVLQAFACGLTVVSSEHPEYRSMHEDGLTTVFVPKKDPNILSDALNDVLANPSTHCHSREQNLDYIRKNENAEKQMDCLLSLLSDFAAERKSA